MSATSGSTLASTMRLLHTVQPSMPTLVRVKSGSKLIERKGTHYESALRSNEELEVCVQKLDQFGLWRMKRGSSMQTNELSQYVTFTNQRIERTLHSKVECLGASALISMSGKKLHHLDLLDLNANMATIARRLEKGNVASLDLSGLGLQDTDAIELLCSRPLERLRWIDLSFNLEISSATVARICEAVSKGKIKNLQWLELSGTKYDATPYVDGFVWRMTEKARLLAESYGYQKWMMLGSRIPEEENSELLDDFERDLSQIRFSEDPMDENS